MQVHSLELEELIDSNYDLISIHTSLPDYKLAYLLNKHLQICLRKERESLYVDDGGQKAVFSVFNYHDDAHDKEWFLLQNKYHGFLKTENTEGLFAAVEATVNKFSYLLPEKKNTDYLLKIEGDYEGDSIHEIVKKISKIEQVITSYIIDVATLKSKDFLII